MFKSSVLSKQAKRRIYDRIMQAALDLKLSNRVQIVEAMSKAKFHLTTKSLQSYSSGRAVPNAETLIGLKKVLKRSIDWLLTGEESEPHDIAALRDMLNTLVAKLNLSTGELDPDLASIMQTLITLSPEDRARLARIVEAFTQKHE